MMKVIALVGIVFAIGCSGFNPDPCPGQVECPGAQTCCPAGDTCSADGTECYAPVPPVVSTGITTAEDCINSEQEPCVSAETEEVDCIPIGATCCVENGRYCPNGEACINGGTECQE
jgi:hypothetical protein